MIPNLASRGMIGFPEGDNKTDTVFGGVHFNLTALEHFNYTLYDNGTISNVSKCYLTFQPHTPALLINHNGTFINSTNCYTAVDEIGTRGITGLTFAGLFGVTMVCILTCLAKHGRQHLPREKRFYPIGRRWQWYWGLFVCACALISLFLNVDVDRFRVQGLPIIVTVFFWYIMCMATTALTWEAVRHWGSWLERQYVDPNPFALRDDDRRAKVEFYLPLWFYFLTWMNFFLVVPRSWTFVQKQRSPEQEAAVTEPTATSVRFKVAAFFLIAAWITTCFSLYHSVKHYKPRNRGLFNRAFGLIRAIPLRFILIVPLNLAVIIYQTLIAFNYQYSLIRADGPVGIIYGWGYGAQLAILLVQVAYGWASPNEDKELVRQRRVRGDDLDRELGLVKRPAWWRRVKGEHLVGSVRDKLVRNVHEIGQKRNIGRRAEGDMERHIREDMEGVAYDEDGFEMRNYASQGEYNPRVDRAGVGKLNHRRSEISLGADPESDRVLQLASGILFPDLDETRRREREAEAERQRRVAFLQEDGPPPPSYYDNVPDRGRTTSGTRPGSSQRSNSTGTINSINVPATKVRSMLDI
ncbi:hypothetical protein ACO1O0_007424 [Amphichorda felina]